MCCPRSWTLLLRLLLRRHSSRMSEVSITTLQGSLSLINYALLLVIAPALELEKIGQQLDDERSGNNSDDDEDHKDHNDHGENDCTRAIAPIAAAKA